MGNIPWQVGRGKGSVCVAGGKQMKVRETRQKQERKKKEREGHSGKRKGEAGEACREGCRPGGDFGNRTGCGGSGKAGAFRASRIGRDTGIVPYQPPESGPRFESGESVLGPAASA